MDKRCPNNAAVCPQGWDRVAIPYNDEPQGVLSNLPLIKKIYPILNIVIKRSKNISPRSARQYL